MEKPIKFTLKFICPSYIFVILCLTFSNLSVVRYKNEAYPVLAHVFGGFVSLSSVVCIPVGAFMVKRNRRIGFSSLWKRVTDDENEEFDDLKL